MAFVAPSLMHAYHDAPDAFLDDSRQHYHADATTPMQDSSTTAGFYPAAMPPISCDIKPRLTKEQHDFLEEHFQKQNKPNTDTKRTFADQLGVSLDKVNNWFQNRRAKLKQDAKKAGALMNVPYGNGSAFSDSESSPAFPSREYFSMMQEVAAEQQMPHGLSLGQAPHMQEQAHAHNTHCADVFGDNFVGGCLTAPYAVQDVFNRPQDMNRRTLTQEQFNALAQDGGLLSRSAEFSMLQHKFSDEQDAAQNVFSELQRADFQGEDDAFTFPVSYGAPLSSDDSTVPSIISDQSVFPHTLAEQISITASPEDWADSHCSSLSASVTSEHSLHYPQMPPATQQSVAASSQWQPGQSKPVDVSALQKQFEEAQAQSQASQVQLKLQSAERPPSYADETNIRRDSQTSTTLTQQMSQFALQTPASAQQSQFKPPGAPSGSIAARRHVKRPAQLGIAALRSVSYSGNTQPSSPNAKPNQQSLRRIQSSVGMSAVTQGRVTKGSVVPAQKSPLSFSFAESLGSPKALRHSSMSSSGTASLAPPTPHSPSEVPSLETVAPQQTSSGQVSRHTSISETDAEHIAMPFAASAYTSQQQNFSSPPHTPMYQHHHPPLFHSNAAHQMILENTPPQSAPACQQSFPANVFMMPQQPTSMPPPPPPPAQLQQTQQMPGFVLEQQQMIGACMPEQQFQIPMVPPQHAHFIIPMAGPPPELPMHPMHFNTDVAMADGQAMLTMVPMSVPASVPAAPQMQFLPYAAPPGYAPLAPQHVRTPHNYSFVTTSSSPSASGGSVLGLSQLTKPLAAAQELLVHEYNPPDDIKQAAAPRIKSIDSGPKAYTFTNQGPEHFVKDRSKKGFAISNSPASSTGSSN